MGEIYVRAEVVYVWLGEGNVRTSRALADLEDPLFMEYLISDSGVEDCAPKIRPLSELLRHYADFSNPKSRLPTFRKKGIVFAQVTCSSKQL